MQYLTWGSNQIPVGFLKGLSYRKTAKTKDHTGGYISACGFETAEISAQIEVTRANCMALDVSFNDWYSFIDKLTVAVDGEVGAVTLGGYPLYPEMNFALTNKNTTRVTDLSSSAPLSIACDIVLSGVECVKEVSRQRALEFDAVQYNLPKVTLTVNGKSLTVQDSTAVSRLAVTPNACEVEICLGTDRTNVNRDAFLNSLVDDKTATITLGLPLGDTTYHIIWSDLANGILQISGSIYTEAAKQTVTETFEDCDIMDIIQYLCSKLGMTADVQISGGIDYCRLNGTPMELLEALQKSAGFVVSSHLGKVTFAFLPNSITSEKTMDLTIDEDSRDELTSGIVWRDGENEFTAGDESGELLRVESIFRSSESKWANECLKLQQYLTNSLVLSGELDSQIRHHSQVSATKDNTEVVGLVDYYTMDFITNTMQLEIHSLS